MSHTKTPWVTNGRYVGVPNHKSSIAECLDQNGNWTNEQRAIANAALIVRAVNAHDALVEALLHLSMFDKGQIKAEYHTLIAAADAALAKAEAA